MTLYTGLAAASASRKLEAFFGIGPGLQQRVGTMVILWAMIEGQVERAVWTLEGERFPAGRPSTDAKQIGDLVGRLIAAAKAVQDPAVATLLQIAATATADLAEVRNTIVHGIPWGQSAGRPTLARNASVLGETRKRPATSLEIDEATLDEIASALDTLFMVIGRVAALAALPGRMDPGFPLELEAKVEAACSMAKALKVRIAGPDRPSGRMTSANPA
jgi:hypothetical protein